jgi:hypothetical protein
VPTTTTTSTASKPHVKPAVCTTPTGNLISEKDARRHAAALQRIKLLALQSGGMHHYLDAAGEVLATGMPMSGDRPRAVRTCAQVRLSSLGRKVIATPWADYL